MSAPPIAPDTAPSPGAPEDDLELPDAASFADEVLPPEDEVVDVSVHFRTALAAGLACSAAALVTGGIFGSWGARGVGVLGVALGVGWALLCLRKPDRSASLQLGLVPVAVALSLVFVLVLGGEPGNVPDLVADAVESGRLLRPPVPFDPGWAPILLVLFALLGFGATWVGTAMDKGRLAIGVPLPALALTAMTQPDDGQFIAGLCAFVPLIAALAVMFGGDGVSSSQLTKDFELKRAGRSLGATGIAVLALFVLSRANILFPEPVFDPDDTPQKPKPIPLSEIEDVVLFEITTDSAITGPWRTGVLDVYDGQAWRLPPFQKERLVTIPPDGVIDARLAEDATESIAFTVRGLQNATALPGTTGPATIQRSPDLEDVKWDPRTGTFRLEEGRIPQGATYTITMPPYPGADELAEAPPPVGDLATTLEIGSPPDFVRQLLQGAPDEPAWARMDFLRTRLRDVVVAAGGGVPEDITPARVAEILEGPEHEATPFEIVAAEAMLARWAGVPSRIGFGFDGFNEEEGLRTIRPRNAAQWLEVYFEGHGWVPLIEPPEQAKSSLDNEDQRFDPDTLAADEVAAEVYVPVKLENFQELYQRLRAELLAIAPFAALVLLAYLSTPAVMKQWRRNKRRRWAEDIGPHAQVAVEYAEFRDFAHDLNLGDPLDTPLEYLKRVTDDEEHAELAWLVARVMYGDLGSSVGEEAVKDAEDLSASLRRRMFRAQPFQVRALAVLSKASLRDPYTDEVPSVVLLDPLGRFGRWRRRQRLARRERARSRRRIGRRVPNPLVFVRRRRIA